MGPIEKRFVIGVLLFGAIVLIAIGNRGGGMQYLGAGMMAVVVLALWMERD